MLQSQRSTSLTITNPLVKYRSLLASKSLRPDPAQHRLALHLEKFYHRLKNYSPELDYRHRLATIQSSLAQAGNDPLDEKQLVSPSRWGLFPGWMSRRPDTEFALTPTVPIQESAISIHSPQGLLLYGEVGRGKSMILDLLAEGLPTDKKRRWHFNAFMLETFRRLEKIRIGRLPSDGRDIDYENSLLSLAKDMVCQSPIIFLDEFQFPDRAASKLLSSFLTCFFHLGGVLIATSNRMPDELAKAAGQEYWHRPNSTSQKSGRPRRDSEVAKAAATDFGAFLDVLKARCEIWEMEGGRDWRRAQEDPKEEPVTSSLLIDSSSTEALTALESPLPPTLQNYCVCPPSLDPETRIADEAKWNSKIKSCLAASTAGDAQPAWAPSSLKVFGRKILVPASLSNGYTFWNFDRLCGTNLGPADYISLASAYHTLILDRVPVLSLALKNEARRFITLLDALYESKCRLLIRADALPDDLFFPELRKSESGFGSTEESGNEVYQETLAEIYQDSSSPFRPNISAYQEASPSPLKESLIPNASLRSVLADEDADFGLNHSSGRAHGAVTLAMGPDFTQTRSLTGEDEKFAYKRATSRLWEMCGEKWWRDRPSERVEDWWRPVPSQVRFWEKPAQTLDNPSWARDLRTLNGDTLFDKSESHDEELFPHGASPFRTSSEPPPKFGWQHAWGMMKWGKKAGQWGKGVEAKQEANHESGEKT